jgi:FMN phosphatase YigB (HAD superfamily)
MTFHQARNMTFRPRYITFDCYGTLTYYAMHHAAYDIYEGQLAPQQLHEFIANFNDYRFDEARGDWKPYHDIIHSSLQRACRKHKLASATNMRSASTTWSRPGGRTPTCRMRSPASPRRFRS